MSYYVDPSQPELTYKTHDLGLEHNHNEVTWLGNVSVFSCPLFSLQLGLNTTLISLE
jgi:hypothetical protein